MDNLTTELNVPVRGEQFDRVCDIFWESLAPSNLGSDKIPYDKLADSLRYLAGRILTPELAEEAAHRIAGNLPNLRRGMRVVPWHIQRFYEWVPVQIMGVRKARNGRNEMGAMLSIKILAGTPCPMTILTWWSNRKCRHLSREFGFSCPPGKRQLLPPKYPYSDPAQLVQMRFSALVDPTKSDREPVLTEIEFPPALSEWNRGVIRRRFREEGVFDCPLSLPVTFGCHHCPMGYGLENESPCAAACHRYDYDERPCPVCGEEKALWDREIPANMCVNCHVRSVYGAETAPKPKEDDD